jgi:GntR family transcriptional repressor for pyruvate dehydrogenase complex
MSRGKPAAPPASDLFNPVGEKRLYQKVVDQICVAIFQGKLRPGDRLPSEEELVSRFQVSRSAVREAIKVLETSGLLRVRWGRGGGSFVQERDTQSLSQAYANILRLAQVEVSELTRGRVLLESLTIREAAKNIRPGDLEALRQNIREARACYRQGLTEERLQKNLDFHVALGRLSGNIILELNIAAILSLLAYYLKTMQVTPEMVEATLKKHARIVTLIEKGQADEAVAANRRHIETVAGQLLAQAEKRFDRTLNGHLFRTGE